MPNEFFTQYNGQKIDEKTLCEILSELAEGRTLVAYFTDRADSVTGIDAEEVKKLLELRAFNETSEFYACRSLIGEEFTCRYIDDKKIPTDDATHMLETHYLDIDTTFTEAGKPVGDLFEYKTMTGGVYHLPIENANRLLLCNYISYKNPEGLAQVYDYRFVRFLTKEAKNDE